MSKINYSRVLIGGIVAGVVWIALDMAGYMLMGGDMDAWFTQHNLHEPPMWVFFALDIFFGFLAVWLYAAIRPRFGPGPRTAATAAVFIWMLFTGVYFMFHMMHLFTAADFGQSTVAGLVTVLVATMAGAWMYREGESPAAPRM